MGNQIEKNYSAFGGLDTRSNKLLQNPKTFRAGSKNVRYNFQDEIQQSNGFQHKDSGAPSFVTQFEYKYRDVNTGAAKIQLLGVATDGKLYRKLDSTLTFTAHGAATSVSVYYDEVADTFKCDMNGLGSVTISDTMTLAQLETALELLAGVAITLAGDTSVKAYLLDCVINDTTFAENKAYYWEVVPFPDAASEPFTNAKNKYNDSDFEGVSTVNLNNSIYITDGGFPMKYDGAAVYRAGMPDILTIPNTNIPSGFLLSGSSSTSDGGLTVSSTYKYKFVPFFLDKSGAEVFGYSGGESSIAMGASTSVDITVPGIRNSSTFPSFSCKCTTSELLNSGNLTFDVASGHNILAGMVLKIPTRVIAPGYGGYYNMNCKVASVTATSITLNAIPFNDRYGMFGTNYTVETGKWYSAGYTESRYENTSSYTFDGYRYNPAAKYASGIRVFRTTSGGSTFYHLTDLPIANGNNSYTWTDSIADARLTLEEGTFSDYYGEPRQCRYLSIWQGQLVQAGRPYSTSIIGSYKPFNFYNTSDNGDFGETYTEADLCDYQSVYWDDAVTVESFPRDGLHEISIDTQFSDRVKGMAPNKDSFFVFKERSTGLVYGDIGTNDVKLEILEADCGCASHLSIQEVRGSIVWLDAINGFYSCVAGRLPENIGFPIQDYFKINSLNLNTLKASAANFRKESLYVCSIGTSTFVFDYADDGQMKRDCWYYWDRLNGKSVVATSDDLLLVNDGTNTWKMKVTKTKYDMTDHKTAISFKLNTAWSHGGAPTIDKHYVGLWMNSIQGDFTLTVKQYGNYLEDIIATQSNVAFMAEGSSKRAIKAQVKAYLPKLSGVSFGLENSEKNKLVRIQGYEIQYGADFDSGEPKR